MPEHRQYSAQTQTLISGVAHASATADGTLPPLLLWFAMTALVAVATAVAGVVVLVAVVVCFVLVRMVVVIGWMAAAAAASLAAAAAAGAAEAVLASLMDKVGAAQAPLQVWRPTASSDSQGSLDPIAPRLCPLLATPGYLAAAPATQVPVENRADLLGRQLQPGSPQLRHSRQMSRWCSCSAG